MGMYDYVTYKSKCPVCETDIHEFQSKDGDCLLEVIDISTVENFYTICDNPMCESWIEYKNSKKGIAMISPSKRELKKMSEIVSYGDAINHSRSKSEVVAKYCMFFLRKKR
jgi:hypothetical protein